MYTHWEQLKYYCHVDITCARNDNILSSRVSVSGTSGQFSSRLRLPNAVFAFFDWREMLNLTNWVKP